MGAGKGRSKRVHSVATPPLVHESDDLLALDFLQRDLVVERGSVEIRRGGRGRIRLRGNSKLTLNGVWEGDVSLTADSSFDLNGTVVGNVLSKGHLVFRGAVYGEINGETEQDPGAKHFAGHYRVASMELRSPDAEGKIVNNLTVEPRPPRPEELEFANTPEPDTVSF